MAHVWNEFTGWLLIAYIELHWSTLSVFFGILASWASLEIVGPFVYPRARTEVSGSELSANDSSSGKESRLKWIHYTRQESNL